GRDTKKTNQGPHGAGVNSPATSPGPWASAVFHRLEFIFVDSTATVSANGFENILNSEITLPQMARRNGATVEREPGNIQTRQCHHHSRVSFVATGKTYQRVEVIAARHQLDGICDHLAADERTFHAFYTHADPIRNGNGVEFHRCSTGGPDTFFYFGR